MGVSTVCYLIARRGRPPPDHPPGEDGERAGLTGDCVMSSPPALALSPYGGAAAAGREPRERQRTGVRSAAAPGCPSREDRKRAGLTGDCVMSSPPALALSPYGGAAAAGHQPRERLRRGVRSAAAPGCPSREDRERAGLIGDCVMSSPSALALSPQGGAAAAGRQPRERLRIGVRSAI